MDFKLYPWMLSILKILCVYTVSREVVRTVVSYSWLSCSISLQSFLRNVLLSIRKVGLFINKRLIWNFSLVISLDKKSTGLGITATENHLSALIFLRRLNRNIGCCLAEEIKVNALHYRSLDIPSNSQKQTSYVDRALLQNVLHIVLTSGK